MSKYVLERFNTGLRVWHAGYKPISNWLDNLIVAAKEMSKESDPEAYVDKDEILSNLLYASKGYMVFYDQWNEQQTVFKHGYTIEFVFETEEDAIMFVLKWS